MVRILTAGKFILSIFSSIVQQLIADRGRATTAYEYRRGSTRRGEAELVELRAHLLGVFRLSVDGRPIAVIGPHHYQVGPITRTLMEDCAAEVRG